MPRVDDRIDIPAPIIGVQLGWRSWALIVGTTVFGLVALGWPFLIPAAQVSSNHSAEAPFILAALVPLMLLLVLAQVTEGGLDTRALATLGVLSAINAVLRPALGAGTAGIEGVFFLLIIAGRAFGPGFAFLLGHLSFFASALLTAGIGPWLPFQMMVSGWVGLAAGLIPRRLKGKAELVAMVIVAVVTSYAYGALMNLWFWPFITGTAVEGVATGSLDYVPGAPLGENLVSFFWFTLFTSTAGWDTMRAVTTGLAVLVLGKPLLQVLRRASGMSRVHV